MIFASFDLDGTLVDSLKLIEMALFERGYFLDKSKLRGFNLIFKDGFAPPPDFQWDLFFYRLFVERWNELRPIDDHVVEFINKVFGDGHEAVKVISARPDGAIIHHATKKTLKSCFPNIDFSIDIVNSHADKYKYAGATPCFFDDRRATVIDLASKGFTVFMRRASYNKIDPLSISGGLLEIENLAASNELYTLRPGDIVLYSDFRQLIDAGVHDYITLPV